MTAQTNENAELKKTIRHLTSEYDKKEAILNQKVFLLEQRLEDNLTRESQLKKVYEQLEKALESDNNSNDQDNTIDTINKMHKKELVEIKTRHREEMQNLEKENQSIRQEVEKLQEKNYELKSMAVMNNSEFAQKNQELEDRIDELESIIASLK